jgi:hypothetical protein
MSKLKFPGLKIGHCKITPARRSNRGLLRAFQEAADSLKQTYNQEVVSPANEEVTWHLLLVRGPSHDRAPRPSFTVGADGGERGA